MYLLVQVHIEALKPADEHNAAAPAFGLCPRTIIFSIALICAYLQ